jgi:hypothetical protein
MKRLVLSVTVFLFVLTAGQALAADKLNTAVSKIESGMIDSLDGIGKAIAGAAKEAGKMGAQNEMELRKLLQDCVAGRSYAIDATFIDNKGIMKFIEPKEYRNHEGSDISKQEAVIRMLKEKQPRMGNVFVSVEGIKSIDIEHPVFTRGKKFLGSISLLVNHEKMLGAFAKPIEKDLGIKCWIMQKDGLILYETDPTQTGLNLFTDPLYRDYPALIALGKQIIKKKQGEGFYTFVIHGTKKVVKKKAVWKTIHFFNNDWIVVAYSEVR